MGVLSVLKNRLLRSVQLVKSGLDGLSCDGEGSLLLPFNWVRLCGVDVRLEDLLYG